MSINEKEEFGFNEEKMIIMSETEIEIECHANKK